MKSLQYTVIFILAIFITSCGNQKSNTTAEEAVADSKPCTYSFKDGTTHVTWTAYKTMEKIGVSGTFDTLNITGLKTANTVIEVFSEANFSILVSSINTDNPDRDQKILEHFFGNMSETSMLTGSVIGVEEDKLNVSITMNGVTNTTLLAINVSDTLVSLSGIISLGDWNALESADALNKICFDLHKGADGVSKLWPDVKLDISAALVKTCE